MTEKPTAFVIWLDPQAPIDGFEGRVEHVGSSTRIRFADQAELLAFLARWQAWRSEPESPE